MPDNWPFKHFKPEEVSGLSLELVGKLDLARDICGFPIEITCGFRSHEHNLEIGGVPGSSHEKGLAADLRSPVDPELKAVLAASLGIAGFKRIEIAPKHLHVDTDPDKRQNYVWQGTDH